LNAGDIYFVSLDPAAGHEQRGTRPILVITSGRFNRLTHTPLVAPITTGGQFARTNGFAVDLSSSGTKTTGIIRCDQLRNLDLDARNARFVEKAPDDILDRVLDLIAEITERKPVQ